MSNPYHTPVDGVTCIAPGCNGVAILGETCEYHRYYRKPKPQITEQLELLSIPAFLRRSPNEVEPNKFDAKATNPKDAIGSKKAGSSLVPDAIVYYASLGLLEGALKYGTANWSEAGVRVSIYLDACGRHLSKFKAGEWADKKTKVPHLASALACIGIILDAHLRGMITDDRTPANPALIEFIDESQATVEHLKKLFADCHPTHYTMESKAPKGRLYTGEE